MGCEPSDIRSKSTVQVPQRKPNLRENWWCEESGFEENSEVKITSQKLHQSTNTGNAQKGQASKQFREFLYLIT